MPQFIINNNAQATGEHEVHNIEAGCSHLPMPSNRISLGFHINCRGAILHAQRQFPGKTIDGCAYCSPQCHTR